MRFDASSVSRSDVADCVDPDGYGSDCRVAEDGDLKVVGDKTVDPAGAAYVSRLVRGGDEHARQVA